MSCNYEEMVFQKVPLLPGFHVFNKANIMRSFSYKFKQAHWSAGQTM